MNNPATDKSNFPLTNVVLVTGSSSGIGKACCDRLANSGRRVYGSCRTQYSGQGWQYTRLDVNDEYSAHCAVEEVTNREGRIDALVHCAGFSLAGSVEDTTVDEAKVQFDTN